jgi:hypothetical protein
MNQQHDCPYSDLIPRLDESVKGIHSSIKEIKEEQTAFLEKIDKVIESKTDKSFSVHGVEVDKTYGGQSGKNYWVIDENSFRPDGNGNILVDCYCYLTKQLAKDGNKENAVEHKIIKTPVVTPITIDSEEYIDAVTTALGGTKVIVP